MNVIASPAPTSTRARIASPIAWVVASTSCPIAISVAPVTISRRDPTRSSITPTGTCIPAYTASCMTLNRLSTNAVVPKRRWASTAATPSDARWNTATEYAAIPRPRISHARRDVRTAAIACLCSGRPERRDPRALGGLDAALL